MLQSIWDDIKREFDYGNMIKRIIIVNVAVYVVINLIWVFISGPAPEVYSGIINFLSISSDPWHMLTHPWSLFTHMFLHEGFWHILWNMLFLFWFGRIFGDLLGDRRVLPLYILGGLAGAAVFIATANMGLFGENLPHTAIGASAAVMAVLVAAGVFAPNYGIRLLLIGEVKLKWIVMALVFMNILGTKGLVNAGGSWGHLGGIAMGFLYAYQLQRGNDMASPIIRWINNIEAFWKNLRLGKKKQRPGPRAAFRRGESVKAGVGKKDKARKKQGASSSKTRPMRSHQEELDAILDKIKEQGYESLSPEEKAFLFRASEK